MLLSSEFQQVRESFVWQLPRQQTSQPDPFLSYHAATTVRRNQSINQPTNQPINEPQSLIQEMFTVRHIFIHVFLRSSVNPLRSPLDGAMEHKFSHGVLLVVKRIAIFGPSHPKFELPISPAHAYPDMYASVTGYIILRGHDTHCTDLLGKTRSQTCERTAPWWHTL